MNLTLLLPWFPVLLGVGVGGRLLRHPRGFALGVLGALFWMALASTGAGPLGASVWHDPWTAATIIIGAIAIVAMGGWAGEAAGAVPSYSAGAKPEPARAAAAAAPVSSPSVLDRLTETFDQFEDWLAHHRDDGDPWPSFDEFLRSALYRCCGATHVRPYRLASDGAELLPLHDGEPFDPPDPLSARRGILGHVATTGRPFYCGDESQGDLVGDLAAPSDRGLVWAFAIQQETRRLGTVAVGRLEFAPASDKALLRHLERMITRLWCSLDEACERRRATTRDPVARLLTREAFLRVSGRSLTESYELGEPVALAVIALEGLREINDSGRWELADELVRAVGDTLRRKVRLDDRLGRFDGSRLLLLLRRVDSELATLIIAQVMSRLTELCGDRGRWPVKVVVRCGLVGSGTEKPTLRSLVSRALKLVHRARCEGLPIASDLGSVRALVESSS